MKNDTLFENALFVDCETDEERSNFFLLGRGTETGITAKALQSDLAMVFRHRHQLKKDNIELNSQLADAEKALRWIPVEVLPPRDQDCHHSKWYILTDGKEWTIGFYDFSLARWSKDHSPFDLSMDKITHWRPITLPEKDEVK